MSRTDKDKPDFVKLKEAFEDGAKVDHYHSAHTGYTRRRVNEASVKVFHVNDKTGISDYYAELKEQGKTPISVETTQYRGLYYSYAHYDWNLSWYDRHEDAELYSSEKPVVKVFYYDYIEIEPLFSSYCTDVEHLDARSRTDTRDGKRISCAPETERRYHKCSKNAVSRSKVKQSLKKVIRHLDDADEYGSIPELTEYYGKKIYTC